MASETERKRSEGVLWVSEERYRTLTESSPGCIMLLDLKGRVVACNDAARKMPGLAKKEAIIGRKIYSVVPEECQSAIKKNLEKVNRGETFCLQMPAPTSTMALSWSDASLVPVRGEGGAVINILFTRRDITHIKQAEEQLIRSEKFAAVGRVTAEVAHEILNPLNIITMGLHVMVDDPDIPPEFVDQVRVLEGQAIRIGKIAQDLLSFTRHRLLERRPVDFNEMIKRTVSLVEHDLKVQDIVVKFKLAEGLPAISADHDQLQQMLLNLLTNARDAMPNGGRLVLSTAEDQSMFSNEGRQIMLRVMDTGPGIPPEHKDKLFDPFFTTKPVGEGTGLGLSICKGIIESHGGVIWTENVPEGGAAFVVHLNVEDK